MKKVADKCEKYGIAITNYVLGEDLRMPQEELMTHLRQCKKCLDELISWQDTYATLRTEAYHAKPENQAKMTKMFEDLKKQVFGTDTRCRAGVGEVVYNTEWKIGGAAGAVYQYLEKSGKSTTLDIFKNTKLNLADLDRAIGWLAKENKICLSESEQTTYAYLPEQK
jgi:hypothetical protein